MYPFLYLFTVLFCDVCVVLCRPCYVCKCKWCVRECKGCERSVCFECHCLNVFFCREIHIPFYMIVGFMPFLNTTLQYGFEI